MTAQKTYWHLLELKRKPSDYDVATSRLLYYPERGFEVSTPLGEWYARHQAGSPLAAEDWERFRDPRETTYTKYVDLQKKKEIYVDGLLASIEATGYDEKLAKPWLEVLARVLGPLRYPVHGLQMIAAYLGSMAPSGRIVVAAAFQAADEMRRIQRFAYRMRQLQEAHRGFGSDSKVRWQEDPRWQPLREVIEKLLVTYDWGESFVALNLVVKPAFDRLFIERFSAAAAEGGDEILCKILASLGEDCAWHREWSRALVEVALASSPDNARAIDGWTARWQPSTDRAIEALSPIFE